MKRFLRSAKVILRQDWGLILVALVVATAFWWDVTQHRMIPRYFPDVEVKLVDLQPSLRLGKAMKPPKVGIRVQGPTQLQDMNSGDFIMRASLARIHDATVNQVSLDPNGFTPITRIPGLSADDLRVRQEDVFPSRIEVITEWNSQVARVFPRYSGRPATGYVISATWVSPATMLLAGSDTDLALHRIIRNKNELVLNGETQTREQIWTLNDLDTGNLTILGDPNKTVHFRIHVEPYYRKRLVSKVPIRVADSIHDPKLEPRPYTISPSSVDLLLQGARTKVNTVVDESLALEIDLSKFPPGETHFPTLRLKPLSLPNDVQILEATPSVLSIWVEAPHGQAPLFQNYAADDIASHLIGSPSSSETGTQAPVPLETAPVPASATKEAHP
jgi:hypothetical protein